MTESPFSFKNPIFFSASHKTSYEHTRRKFEVKQSKRQLNFGSPVSQVSFKPYDLSSFKNFVEMQAAQQPQPEAQRQLKSLFDKFAAVKTPVSKVASPAKPEWRVKASPASEFKVEFNAHSVTPMPKMPLQYTEVSPLIKQEQKPFRVDQVTRERI